MKVLELPGVEVFGGWEYMMEYMNKKGNPLFSVKGDLVLYGTEIESLDNIISVGGYLDLGGTEIKSLDNLVSVGGYLDLTASQIKSLDNLKYVGGDLISYWTPLSKTTTEEEIRQQVEVGGMIYL